MSIFISVASYEDPTLVKTLRSALENADKPKEITFGLGLQYSDMPDLSEFDQSQLRVIEYDPQTRPGLIRIRYEISKLVKKEKYFLTIDSHTRFVPGWDTEFKTILKEIQSGTNTKNVIVFALEKYGDEVMTSRFVPGPYDDQYRKMRGFPEFVFNPIPVNGRAVPKSDVTPIPFMRSTQTFMESRYVKEVGLDPFSHKTQETAYLSFKAFISGWDVYQYHKQLLIHDDTEYMKHVWGGDRSNRKNGTVEDNIFTEYELALAYLYNDYSKYAVKNPVRSPKEFWKANGAAKEFAEFKKIADNFIYNSLQ